VRRVGLHTSRSGASPDPLGRPAQRAALSEGSESRASDERSSRTLGAVRVFPGTSAVEDPSAEGLPNNGEVGVYPNPFRLEAAWDGELATQRKLYFFNLPPRAVIRIYTMAGEIVTELNHDAATYRGDIRWYDTFSADNRVVASGEHAWDVLSENNLRLASGLYFFSVQDEDTGDVQTGKFVIIR
ncbi:MAG: hypothetical protein AAFV01_12150, partial [Bacteroidota bacterium]